MTTTLERADDELVNAAIDRARANPDSWWITRFGTVLVHSPDVAMWVRDGYRRFRFGVGMPPVFDRDDIAPIAISGRDSGLLWDTLEWVKAEQMRLRRQKALASVGR